MRFSHIVAVALLGTAVSGCATGVGLPTGGPGAARIERTDGEAFRVIPLTLEVAASIPKPAMGFAHLPAPQGLSGAIGHGDAVEVAIWEASPSTLFGGGLESGGGRAVSLPTQIVASDGDITIPFVGRINVAGRMPNDIADEIQKSLTGKANLAQVLVRRVSNVASEVTVIGQVESSKRMQLTAKGERLLDAIADAGGTTVPVDKATVQVTRDGVTASAPLDAVVRDATQNVALGSGDVVAVFHQPKSFVAMGALVKPGQIDFEVNGLQLSEAIARAGGLNDGKANARGLFVARLVDGAPTVYQLDLRDPASLFVMRAFDMEDGDIVYVATAPGFELQKFLSLIGSALYPLDAARNIGR